MECVRVRRPSVQQRDFMHLQSAAKPSAMAQALQEVQCKSGLLTLSNPEASDVRTYLVGAGVVKV